MVGAPDQQRSQVDVAGLGDAQLRVAIPGLAAFGREAEVAASTAAALEALLAALRQDGCQCSAHQRVWKTPEIYCQDTFRQYPLLQLSAIERNFKDVTGRQAFPKSRVC